MQISRMMRATAGLGLTLAAALTGAVGVGTGAAQADDSRQAAEEQLLHYNHAYAVVSRETADAIENSEFLRDFASFEVRETVAGDLTWTGRYLYGSETYLEFFGEGDLPGDDALYGASGLALSTETAGGLATVTENLADLGITEPAEYLQTRDFGDGVRVPWFDTIRTTGVLYDAFDPWAMEYQPEYFADPRSNTGPASYPGDTSRARYLPDTYQDHLMKDVTAIRIAVPERDLDNTVPLLEAGGFDVETLSNGSVVVNDGLTEIRLDPVALEDVGLRSIELSLNEYQRYMTEEQIGDSTLSIGPGASAVWTFEGHR
ncbi:DUF5829 family protein [Streptomyces sp. RFCAC02]|uniref:DUF5829 family protein n=1 Tax=Streptomyces sp. RFCAC02 TaxID=2499143 RepID=UPI001F10CA7F|nr:DUF5829 family protein [Streptomyces sp. RFCAC02]